MAARFEGRQVVVTGGTGALGTVVVERLLAEGATCHVPCADDRELGRFVHQGKPGIKIVRDMDLRDERSVERLYEDVAAAGPLWASLHIAGGFAMSPVEQTSWSDFDGQWRMNAGTCFLCCREAIRRMKAGGRGGRIVNVAARPALEPRTGAGMAAYTASKAAVAALTQALAQEVVADGVLVNAVAPSIIDTPANRAAMPNADFSQWVKTGDVASAILYLASPENGGIRGTVVTAYAGA